VRRYLVEPVDDVYADPVVAAQEVPDADDEGLQKGVYLSIFL